MIVALLNAKLPLTVTRPCINILNDATVNVYDDEKTWCVINPNNFHFTINNPTLKDFCLLALDKCCLDQSFIGKRCDFSILIENEHLYLVEIKDTKPKRKARPIQQLENTIIHFNNLSITNNFPNLTAVVSWGFRPPRPLTNSSYNTAKFRFKSSYGFDLMEGNEVII